MSRRIGPVDCHDDSRMCLGSTPGRTLASAFFLATGPAIGGDESEKWPEGVVWIRGGEFAMGAAVNGQHNSEISMASNDAEPIYRVRVDGF